MNTDLWQYLKSADKPIVLYGMGNGADKIYNELKNNGIEISGIFATAEFVREKTVYGFPLVDYSVIKEKLGQMIVLVCFGSNRAEVFEEINRIAKEQELYFPDVPVYGDDIFTLEYAKIYKENLKSVYSLLADDISRKTFENTVLYKLTGKCEYLYKCEVSPDEPYDSFLKLTDNETYLDLGAYNGDTVLDFYNRTTSYNEIIAVEPSARSFKKLNENTEHIDNVQYVNEYVSDTKRMIEISKGRGRGTAKTGSGVEVLANTVDNIVDGRKITFLKADVEGEEIAMLKGAKNTIKNCLPKMQIACYHKSDDLWTIPEAVLKIAENYDVYMRHFPYLPAWDTNFYFVPKK